MKIKPIKAWIGVGSSYMSDLVFHQIFPTKAEAQKLLKGWKIIQVTITPNKGLQDAKR